MVYIHLSAIHRFNSGLGGVSDSYLPTLAAVAISDVAKQNGVDRVTGGEIKFSVSQISVGCQIN